ncbi:sensor histidine kinase [Hymenobacter sp. RP-2-7]|uniref:histidine kinase n=1 Tax=Hymenobacter polaris TaxID=2682546 RepID=A0A7Y0ADC9_9BACT|nr:sensor histidine kinase [Hymenobacter polaris]NML65259.1 sensor histidine kinase [Hymenobacter polaris]
MDAPSEVTFGKLLLTGIAFMLLAAGLLVAFVVVYQRRLLAQQQRQLAAEATYQRQLLAAVIEAQERERERIGRDLHDGIGSTIATAKLLLNRLGAGAAATNPDGLLALVQEIMAGAVHDVRSVSHNLYPVVLARFGLAEALQHLVDMSNEAGGVAVSLALHYPQPLALAQELALYRICQELLHNALKHAQGATQLQVVLEQRGAQLALVVEDDGCGFEPTPPAAAGTPDVAAGAGLRSIDVRVQLLRARLHRRTAPGQGTHTRIELDHPATGEPKG